MKKILLSALVLFALSQAASAAASPKPYVGIGYQLNALNINDDSINGIVLKGDKFLEDQLSNINVFAGLDFGNNLSAELGFFRKSGDKTNNSTGLAWIDNNNALTTKSDSTLQIINLDGIYSSPVASTFKLLAIASISQINYKYDINFLDNGATRASVSIKDNGFGYGLGIGFEAKLIENLSARVTAKYVKTASIDAFDDMLIYNFGLKYGF